MPGLIDSDLGLAQVDTGLMWLEGGLGGSGLWNGDSINPPGTMITEDGITMITESVVVPDWVMSVGDFVAKVDIDFVGDEAWNGSELAISDILGCSRATPALTYAQTSAGALTSFAANTLRYTDLGLLVEDARTNVNFRSQTLDDAFWTPSACTVQADATAAPDGTTTADKLKEDNTSAFHRLDSTAAVIAAGTCTHSVYAKAAERSWLIIFDVSTGNTAVWFHLSGAGSIGTTQASSTGSKIDALANGWYRCQCQFSTGGAVNIAFAPADADGSFSYQGVTGSGVYLWGAQSEAGAFATSYIPTTTTSVTRSPDLVTYAQSLSVFTVADGTFCLEISGYQTLDAYSGGVSVGSTPHTFLLAQNVSWETADQSSADVAVSGVTTGTGIIAASYGGGGGRNQAISVNGSAAVSATAPNNVAAFSALYIGTNAANHAGNGYMPRFTFWDVQLSNTDLVTLSNGDGGTGGVTGGATMITETDLTPSWVLSVGGFGADLDIDFVGDQAWDGASVAISSLLTCSRASPALTYAQTSTGALTSFAANTLRYTDLGLLVEEGRTNLLLQSQTLDVSGGGGWNTNQASIVANQAVAPNGTTTMDALIPSNASGLTPFVSQAITISNSTVYTMSVYVKNGTLGNNWIALGVSGFPSNPAAYFNLATGAKGSATGSATSWNITALANGIYRIDLTATSNDTSSTLYIVAATADLTLNVTGDGVSPAFYAWGAQFEAGTFPTSYIPTTTTSVARDYDAVTATSGFNWDVDGTTYAQLSIAGTPNNGRIVNSLGAPSFASPLIIFGSGPDVSLYSNGFLATTGNGYTVNVSSKVASAYDHLGSSICLDGGTVATNSTDQSATFGSGAQLALGSQYGSSGSTITSYIARLALWDVRLTNANLVTLTS